jgi:thymidylate synthase (FAD)
VKQVLDHGYVDFIEAWGSDERIIEAARMSTGKGFNGWGPYCSKCGVKVVHALGSISPADYERGETQKMCEHDADKPGDEKLLAYLYANKHATPFEMAGLVIEVKAPIFVFREWHRHRTQSYNEMSARYTPLPDENYIPSVERLMANARDGNKQAGTVKGAEELTVEKAELFRAFLARSYKNAQAGYEKALADGVPKELARIHLPVGRYSRMRASANLRNWLAFITLRADAKAQQEIREYALAVGELIARRFPRTWDLFTGGEQR